MATSKPILFVDDDANALAGFQRTLRSEFTVEVAQGGPRGIQMLMTRGPYAVIVSDMRMPIMNGVQFLQRAHDVAPDAVRIMLTGNADLQTAIDAVNAASIFQFLCKPLPPIQLAKTLTAAVAHHELICNERELREQTLRGSVKVLTDLLSLINPLAFGRAMRVADTVRQLAAAVAPREAWQFELAAMLSQLGCITLAPSLLDAIANGRPVSDEDRARFDHHPQVARELIAHIPRFGEVADMIARQQERYAERGPAPDGATPDIATLGARMLRLALDVDALTSTGVSEDDAVARLTNQPGDYDPRLLLALNRSAEADAADLSQIARVALDDLQIGMELQEDIRTASGLVLISKGQVVTAPLQQRVGNFLRLNAVFGTVRVLVPAARTRGSSTSS
jgi:response regulator RpfG family c-di-GMP phosphodiesterase